MADAVVELKVARKWRRCYRASGGLEGMIRRSRVEIVNLGDAILDVGLVRLG